MTTQEKKLEELWRSAIDSSPTESPCWCGLSKEEHDGRELDSNNNLHRFGEQVNPPSPIHYYEDEERESSKPTAENKESHLLLSNIRTFLEHFVIVPARNGSKKFPLVVVNNATELVRRIEKDFGRSVVSQSETE